MSTAFVKFNNFIKDLGDGVHDLNTDVLQVYLSDTAPNAATNTIKANVPEIATGHGYAGPVNMNNSYDQVAGVGTCACRASILITAAGGPIGPFRYLVLFNSSRAGGPLIGFYDIGADATLVDGATFTINFDTPPQVAFTLQ